MRLHRFFVENEIVSGKPVLVEDIELLHQWRNVFRLRPEDKVILLDNSGREFLCQIKTLEKNGAELFIVEEKSAELETRGGEVWLLSSIIKKDNFEWVVEKCTELGVSGFTPVISERSEKKSLNIERLQKIIKEASEQSGRRKMPVIQKEKSLAEVIQSFDGKIVAFDPTGEKIKKDFFVSQTVSQREKIGLLVGPEGGFSEAELALFKEKNIQIFSLGKQILRAETASVVTASLFLLPN